MISFILNLVLRNYHNHLTFCCNSHCSLAHNCISSEGVAKLLDTLQQCESVVKTINLDSNALDDKCMKSVGKYLQGTNSLEIINFARNDFSDKGIEILSKYLVGNCRLAEINLTWNSKISDDSFPYIENIIMSSRVSEVNVDRTFISPKIRQKILDLIEDQMKQRLQTPSLYTKSAAKIFVAST